MVENEADSGSERPDAAQSQDHRDPARSGGVNRDEASDTESFHFMNERLALLTTALLAAEADREELSKLVRVLKRRLDEQIDANSVQADTIEKCHGLTRDYESRIAYLLQQVEEDRVDEHYPHQTDSGITFLQRLSKWIGK